jgi:mevalonate kinase
MSPRASLVEGYGPSLNADRSEDRRRTPEYYAPAESPVVLAPGRVYLVGEYALAEEECAVVAAITRHAKAQFVPRKAMMSALAAEVVKRAPVETGGTFTALPTGSVSIDVEDFRANGRLAGFGSSAAAAVASVGALLETLGMPVKSRKSLIFATATAGRRSALGDGTSEADSLLATYGGLLQISRVPGRAPEILPLEPPVHPHLVLFAAPSSVPQEEVLKGIRRYAMSHRAEFEAKRRQLRELAQRFADEISAGHVTRALHTVSRYTDELACLGVEARVPLMNEPFTLAAGFARGLGGVAKPTTADSGDIGVALFETRAAADKFREAIAPYLTVLDGDLDWLGVRCEGWSAELDEGPTAVDCPSPPPVAPVHAKVDDVARAPRVAASGATARVKSARRKGRWILPVLATAAAVALGAWLAWRRPLGDQGRAHAAATYSALPTVAAPAIPSR